ncbi:TTL domain-containing protein [Paracoccidioides lutzii Pb01]|uniref:TTL domain-containing protein n=1 Tax=Paracoccidioides lutzii (strain ATCC MYA-826 / Pb01) TaxID=502779 RepID=C1GTP8_PARBA|nr:TTL domain-containing protein [Paracoccidioides lutzii Pb01]EEH39704.2 TTL domain-containing protein [Paracoccidioides lutzii Pb01]
MDNETGPNQTLYSRALSFITETAQTIVSKSAQRAYLNTALFALSSFILFCISVAAYWIFYYNYVPQIGLERQVHLQFGDGHPHGTATLGAELISGQQYDVSVILYLPRTPSNLAAGNFMLDLKLFSTTDTSNTNTSMKADLVKGSRRFAILTYASPMVDTVRRVSKIPLYVLGWQREAEGLKVSMMEQAEFGKKKQAMPKVLRLEIQSVERMQIYNVAVRFDARFSGLRWIIYNWRILSFLIFSSTFWVVAMICTSSVWLALASQKEATSIKRPKLEEEEEAEEAKKDGGSSDVAVKEDESEEEGGNYPGLGLEHDGQQSSEVEMIKKEEDIEESSKIQPFVREAEVHNEADADIPASGSSTQTVVGGRDAEQAVQRRRSHVNADTPAASAQTPYPLTMHILVVNDDGPPSNQSSPYVHSLVHTLQSSGHVVSVVLPHRQRSWIGKAHLVGDTVKPTYFRPGTLYKDDGTIHHLPLGAEGESGNPDPNCDEWILIDSTPASCVQIGLFHYFKDRGPIDLVISGPNYGRNTTAVFALSSGTIGGAMEAAMCGLKAIALSFAFSSRDHDPIVIAEASRHSVRLIGYVYENWGKDVDLYSINVPLEPGVSEGKVLYTDILQNRWTSGSCFEALDAEESGEGPDLQEQKLRQAGELDAGTQKGKAAGTSTGTGTTTPQYRHMHFKWAPKFADVYKSVELSPPGNDGWAVKEGITSVTPLRANFMHSPGYTGEIQLFVKKPIFYALVECQDSYVQPLVIQAFRKRLPGKSYELIFSLCELPDPSSPLLQYRVYELCDFEHVLRHPKTSLVNSYVIRKALIRKHYLSNIITNWVAKHPDSILKTHFKQAVCFELDYAEFLDEALVEAYELQESFEANEGKEEEEKEWWILKPGMGDRGRGIRLFNSESSLRAIFEEWEEDQSDSDHDEDSDNSHIHANEGTYGHKYNDDADDGNDNNGVITSQLRHFIAQPYIHPPLLLPSESNRKFHIRTYVLAVGSLQVYVYKEMLALFAERPYLPPWHRGADITEELTRHLTNTCLQTDSNGVSKRNAVRRFWALGDAVIPFCSSAAGGSGSNSARWKENVYEQVCAVTGEVFEAAARGMPVHFQTLPNAFELFGVDFLVDGHGKVWLLELNAFPDFQQTGDELKGDVVGRLFEGVVEVAVKPFFGIDGRTEEARIGEEKFGLRLVRDLKMGVKG